VSLRRLRDRRWQAAPTTAKKPTTGLRRGSEHIAWRIVGMVALAVCALTHACRQTREDPSGQGSSTNGPDRGRSGRTIRASTSAEIAPLEVGQWVRYAIRYADGRSDQLTYKVVEREPNGLWVELVSGKPNAGTVLELLIGAGSLAAFDGSRILAARISMPNGAVRELRGVMLEPSRPGYLKALSPLLRAPFASAPKERVATAAGAFEDCSRLDRELVFGELHGGFTVWMHTAVPLTGLVRATAKSGEATVEVDDFGMQGARASLKRRG
jgi:hypothetical protein